MMVPSGVTWKPALTPTDRLNPGCGSAKRKPISAASRIRFQRLIPVSQSAMYSPRRSRFSASSVDSSSYSQVPWAVGRSRNTPSSVSLWSSLRRVSCQRPLSPAVK